MPRDIHDQPGALPGEEKPERTAAHAAWLADNDVRVVAESDKALTLTEAGWRRAVADAAAADDLRHLDGFVTLAGDVRLMAVVDGPAGTVELQTVISPLPLTSLFSVEL